MKKNGVEVMPCHMSSEFQKEWIYEQFKPDIAVGVGFWGHTPDVIQHPQKFGVQPVPWFVADGWVAGFHAELAALPLAFVTSTWVKERYIRDGVDTKNFEVMPIGFDPDLFHSIPKTDERVRTLRKKLGIADDEVMLLTVGGDVTSKGAQEVFQALKLLGKKMPKWKYVCKVWGGASADDHYEDEMRLIDELGDDKDRVIYLDGSFSREFMPVMLNASDVYLAPSRLEGFGMIQMEAQACGVPVISIDGMGPKEVIVNGKTGFLASVADTVVLNEEITPSFMGKPSGHRQVFGKPKIFAYRASVEDIADKLLKLASDTDLRDEMGKAAAKHAMEKFHYQDIARRFEEIVKSKLKIS